MNEAAVATRNPVASGHESGAELGVVSVLIFVEVCLYRDGLARAIDRDEKMMVVERTADLEQARRGIARLQPDVVLFDPASDPSFTLVALAAKVAPRTRLVALGVREAEADVLRCAEAGVAAYVARDASMAELLRVVVSTANGELRCSPRIAASLFRRVAFLAEGTAEPVQQPLTPRESEVVALIDEGLSNKQIAQRLQIGVSTVKNHVHNLLKKLNTSRRTVAAARARRARRARDTRTASGNSRQARRR